MLQRNRGSQQRDINCDAEKFLATDMSRNTHSPARNSPLSHVTLPHLHMLFKIVLSVRFFLLKYVTV